MSDLCGDSRFEIIEAYKKRLIEDTNIEKCPEEMAVIDNILFRFWQMGWIPEEEIIRCIDCKHVKHDILFNELWCKGRKVSEDHYCGYAERKERDEGI